jgi:hypothetical protein
MFHAPEEIPEKDQLRESKPDRGHRDELVDRL